MPLSTIFQLYRGGQFYWLKVMLNTINLNMKPHIVGINTFLMNVRLFLEHILLFFSQMNSL